MSRFQGLQNRDKRIERDLIVLSQSEYKFHTYVIVLYTFSYRFGSTYIS